LAWRRAPLAADGATTGSTAGLGAVAAARVARSRPNFLQKWCKATVETWAPQVRWMKAEHVVARGVGVGQDELGDGAGIARQQFAMRPTGQAVVGGLDRLLEETPCWCEAVGRLMPTRRAM
jgi:hypothetical protein